MATNKQLWQIQPGEPGTIQESQVPSNVDDRKLLVKVRSWAINPCDAILQDRALPIVKYPIILGQDISGTVEQVGSIAAQKFSKGDKIFGFTINNAFQEYAPVDYTLAAKIPDGVSFNEAVVFGLCCTTSAYSLFAPDHLALPLPSLDSEPIGKSILIWGGSSAVGSNAIQLAKGVGLEVFTTCSSRSFEYVRSLGADHVFDYSDLTVTDEIAAALDKGICAGIYLAAGNVADACQVSAKSKQKLFVSSSNPVMPGDCPEGVEAKMAYSTSGAEAFAPAIAATWNGYLVEALSKGKYKVAPAPQIVSEKGVEGIQVALDMWKKGVSATKLVVEAF